MAMAAEIGHRGVRGGEEGLYSVHVDKSTAVFEQNTLLIAVPSAEASLDHEKHRKGGTRLHLALCLCLWPHVCTCFFWCRGGGDF